MNRRPISLLSPRERARLAATLDQARAAGDLTIVDRLIRGEIESPRTQRNTEIVALGRACASEPAARPGSAEPVVHSDARCTCGAYLYRAEIPHPDRDLDVFPRACEECRKSGYLKDFREDLDQALWEAWVREPLALIGLDGDPRPPLTSQASLP